MTSNEVERIIRLEQRTSEDIKIMREGGSVACPVCGEGKMSQVANWQFVCDKCGNGIYGTLNPL